MNTQSQITNDERRVCNSRFATRNSPAFSLVEVLIVITLLSLIVLALMQVFSTTQRAFRASVTQTDVLEGGRDAVDMIAQDLKQITPSGSYSNNAVNFFTLDNDYSPALGYSPLVQNLPGSGASWTNFLNYFFLLGRENTKWIGIGYAVNSTNITPLYPLYRFYEETNLATSPGILLTNFLNIINQGLWTNGNMSHVLDGVVHLVVRADNPNGYSMTNTYQFNGSQWVTNKNVRFYPPAWPGGVVGFSFYSNSVPAAVELQIGILEDRPLTRAQSLPYGLPAQLNYLQQQSGHVHVFRQQVTIPNLDPTAYQ